MQKARSQMENTVEQKNKNNSLISVLSNPFSTGNGGGDFEHRVQATFLLGLLMESFSPILNTPITSVDFQAKRLGWDTDDIMVSSVTENYSAKLLCQIKHGIKMGSNETFKKVVLSAWNDYKNPDFNQQTDKIAVITNSSTRTNELRFIHDQAVLASSTSDFVDRINRAQYSNGTTRNVFKNIKDSIREKFTITISEEELWTFCKVFTVLTFDMDYESSVNEFLIYALLASNCQKDTRFVWATMIDIAARYDKSAAHVTLDNIPDNIKKCFSYMIFDESAPLVSNNYIDNSFWAKLALIGAWDEENQNDGLLLESFFGSKYTDIQSKVQEYSQLPNANISFDNGIWRIKHRFSIIRTCASQYFDNVIRELFSLSEKVFSERNKRIQPDGTTSILVPSGGAFGYSTSLRNGLLHSMAFMCNCLKENLPGTDGLIETESWKFIRNIWGNFDYIIWMRLDSDLPIIAEINPSEFLSCLEKSIVNDPGSMEKLFPKSSADLLFSNNYICPVLWALEGLAWSDKYFVKSIRMLGLLASLNYEKINSSNTPINSIVSIMLPWHLQTFASKEKQKNAIKALQEECPDVAWKVVVKLLPHATRMTGGTHHPQYILPQKSDTVNISDYEKIELYAYYSDVALSIAKKDYTKFCALLTHCNEMGNVVFKNFLQLILEQCPTWTDAQKYPFWNVLQNQKAILNHNESASIDTSSLNLLNSCIEQTTPLDIRCRYKRLYESNYIDFNDEENLRTRWERRRKLQESSVYEIYTTFGIDAVVQFGEDISNPNCVAQNLGKGLSIKECDDLLALCSIEKLDRNFLVSIIVGLVVQNGCDILLEIDFGKYPVDFVSWLLSHLPLSMRLFEIANIILKQDIKLFWQSAVIPHFGLNPEVDLNYVWNCLVEQNRYNAAINLYWCSAESCTIDDKELHGVLINAATTESNEEIEPDAIRNLIGLLQQNRRISINDISDVELIYLPLLDEYSKVQPKALRYRLANEPKFFCELVELLYKKRHAEKHEKVLSENMSRRLWEIFYHYCVVPGTDWEGNYDENKFNRWISYCKEWGRNEDRTEIVLQIIGNGLSYATVCENGLPDMFIMKELNKPDNEEMRLGYRIGVYNQRGISCIDPEGKPEYELAGKFEKMSNDAESLGYAKYAETLHLLAEEYVEEAKRNIQNHKREQECLQENE